MGTKLPPQRGTAPTIFDPSLLCSKGWMDQDATWYWRRPHPRQHTQSPLKGAQHPPQFSAHVYCCQRVADLSNCWALVHGWHQCFVFPWMFWHCWLGNRKNIRPVKNICTDYHQRFAWNRWKERINRAPCCQIVARYFEGLLLTLSLVLQTVALTLNLTLLTPICPVLVPGL